MIELIERVHAGDGAEDLELRYLGFRGRFVRHFGAINGCGYAAYNAGAAASPFVVGRLYSVTGSYALALEITSGLCLVAAASLLTLGQYPKR